MVYWKELLLPVAIHSDYITGLERIFSFSMKRKLETVVFGNVFPYPFHAFLHHFSYIPSVSQVEFLDRFRVDVVYERLVVRIVDDGDVVIRRIVIICSVAVAVDVAVVCVCVVVCVVHSTCFRQVFEPTAY